MTSDSSSTLLAPRKMLSDPALILDQRGHRSLHYFQHRASREFSGYFDNDFWSCLVLQIGHRESCVRQLIVALGTLHESFQTGDDTPGNSEADSLRNQSISEYTKGVRLLNDHIFNRGWAALDVTLASSVLCIIFEWLRGAYSAAHTHLRSSLSILSQWHTNGASLPNCTSFWSPGGHMIRTKLEPLYTTMVLQARTMPSFPAVPLRLARQTRDEMEPFSTLKEARDMLYSLLAYLLPEILSHSNTAATLETQEDRNLGRLLAQWSINFTEYLARNPTADNPSDNPGVEVLKLWHIGGHMLFANRHSQTETAHDQFHAEFDLIVAGAERLLLHSSSSAASYTSCFSVDIGVVPLLYFVAVKCRHPQTRRRAVALLEASPRRREAVWDSVGAARLAREIVAIEEEGLGDVRGYRDVPWWARVRRMRAEIDLENRSVRMRAGRQGEEGWSHEKLLTW